jgi:hypothetical protein
MELRLRRSGRSDQGHKKHAEEARSHVCVNLIFWVQASDFKDLTRGSLTA